MDHSFAGGVTHTFLLVLYKLCNNRCKLPPPTVLKHNPISGTLASFTWSPGLPQPLAPTVPLTAPGLQAQLSLTVEVPAQGGVGRRGLFWPSTVHPLAKALNPQRPKY